jgi:hypothetical protein
MAAIVTDFSREANRWETRSDKRFIGVSLPFLRQ